MLINNSLYKQTYLNTKSSKTLQTNLLLSLIGTLFLILSAKVSLYSFPVPITLQSLSVLSIGFILGKKLGLLCLINYFLLGLLGFPVFAGLNTGILIFSLPTLGYLLGFFPAIYIVGYLAEKTNSHKLCTTLIFLLLAQQIILITGTIYLSFYLNISLIQAFTLGYLPFLAAEVIKAVILAPIINKFQHKNI